jgi:hypothetical protein
MFWVTRQHNDGCLSFMISSSLRQPAFRISEQQQEQEVKAKHSQGGRSTESSRKKERDAAPLKMHRAISVFFLGRLLARAQSWAPPLTAAFRGGGGGWTSSRLDVATTRASSTTTCLGQSSLSVDTTTPTSGPSSSSGTVIVADDDVFVKPERDSRLYRLLRLSNQLQVMLVSDQLATGDIGLEAGSIHVQSGHFDDTVPGLAHFHEHLLFLGTLLLLLLLLS